MTDIALATASPTSLVSKMAGRYGVDPTKLLTTLKATAFRQRNNVQISNEQMMALLVVADQYELNPFTKEIYAFEDRGAIVPIVSVDGWARIINQHPELDGIEFSYSEKLLELSNAKPCPEWCEGRIYRKDRSYPIVVREYLDEVYQPMRGTPPKPGPWQTHTKRFLRHKTLIQTARVAFGFAGIYDEDEGKRVIEAEAIRATPSGGAAVASLAERIEQARSGDQAPDTSPEDAEFTETRPADVDPDTGEVTIDPKKLRARLHLADTPEALDDAASDIDLLPASEEREAIRDLYAQRLHDMGRA